MAPAHDVVVTCNDLSLTRRRAGRGSIRVVDGVSMNLPPASTLMILGPTGSGKSSLAAMLAGAHEPGLAVDGGEAHVHGISVRTRGRGLHVRRYRTGWIRQRAGAELPPRFTVEQIIAAPVTERSRHVNGHALAIRVATLLDELGLPIGLGEKYPYELSAGMRQRVAVARALMLQPPLLVADGAFTALDARARAAVLAAFRRRRDGYGMAMLLFGGDTAVARQLDARGMVLCDGHVVASGAHIDALRWTPGVVPDVVPDVPSHVRPEEQPVAS